MKIKYWGLALLVAAVLVPASAWASPDSCKLYLDGNLINLDNMGEPIEKNGRILVPLRVISENMGYQVEWNKTQKSVEIHHGEDHIHFAIGSKEARVNQSHHQLDMPAQVINGRTYVPIRFLSEHMGAAVDYHAADGQKYVLVARPGVPQKAVDIPGGQHHPEPEHGLTQSQLDHYKDPEHSAKIPRTQHHPEPEHPEPEHSGK